MIIDDRFVNTQGNANVNGRKNEWSEREGCLEELIKKGRVRCLWEWTKGERKKGVCKLKGQTV